MASSPTQNIDLDEYPASYFFTVAEVKEILRYDSDKPVRTLVKNGKLTAINVGGKERGQYRIQKRALVEYIEQCVVKPPSAGRKGASRQAHGKPFKHITATWLHESASPEDGQSKQPSRRRSRSSKGAPGREN